MSEPEKDPEIQQAPTPEHRTRPEFSMEALFYRPGASEERLRRIVPEIIEAVHRAHHEAAPSLSPDEDISVESVVEALKIASTVDPLPEPPQDPSSHA